MSLKINKDTTNTVVLTLCDREILTASTKYYLFQFTDEVGNDTFFVGDDLSTYPCNYNQFSIIETGSTFVNLTATTVNLEPTGYWDYKVYEQLSPTNLSISGTSGVVLEWGKVLVIGDIVPTQVSYTGDTLNNNTEYFYE